MLIWKQAGYLMIFYISGLQGISRELYEAARIDGAGAVRSFLKITWPLLKPVTIYVTIISLTMAYKMVDHLYIMTKGGPNNATNMLLYYVYQNGFEFWDIGYASTITVVLVTMLLVLTCVHFFTQDRRTFYS
jgi:sn-glycerol 3-phosphate transport system permease protein